MININLMVHCRKCGKNLTLWGRKGSDEDFQCIYCGNKMKIIPRKWTLATIQLLSYSTFILVNLLVVAIFKHVKSLCKFDVVLTPKGVLITGALLLLILVIWHSVFIAVFTCVSDCPSTSEKDK